MLRLRRRKADLNIDELWDEVNTYLKQVSVEIDGEHIWSNYQNVVAIILRLQEMHNQLALLEIAGSATPEAKKFRTMIVDPTIERLEKVASFESRKMTGKQIESQLER
jgi:hypothetical protein